MSMLLAAALCLVQGDPAKIEWITPGDFKKAQARATAETRLIVIKGISFGVDKLGATCATKGDW